MMKQTRLLMGMPIIVEVVDSSAQHHDLDRVFAYFTWVDETFSPYKASSEISRLNRGELHEDECSDGMKAILALAERTKRETDGYFDIVRAGVRDPSGIVKGWAIQHAAQVLRDAGLRNFYVDAGGDLQVCGTKYGELWRVGIRNPFNRDQNVKVLDLGHGDSRPAHLRPASPRSTLTGGGEHHRHRTRCPGRRPVRDRGVCNGA